MTERENPETVYWQDGLRSNRGDQAVGVVQTTRQCRQCDLYRVLADGILACPGCEQNLLLMYRRSEVPETWTQAPLNDCPVLESAPVSSSPALRARPSQKRRHGHRRPSCGKVGVKFVTPVADRTQPR